MKLFELEKVFKRNWSNIEENYSLAWVQLSNKDLVYYDIQNTVSNFFKTVGIPKYMFDICKTTPSFAHSWRTASIVIRGKEVWTIWEIHPKVSNNFWINNRIWYFEINISKIEN